MTVYFPLTKGMRFEDEEEWSGPYHCTLHVLAGGTEFVSRTAVAQFTGDYLDDPDHLAWEGVFESQDGRSFNMTTSERSVRIMTDHVAAVWVTLGDHFNGPF